MPGTCWLVNPKDPAVSTEDVRDVHVVEKIFRNIKYKRNIKAKEGGEEIRKKTATHLLC